MLGKVFKAYDIRGTYPDPLNDHMAWQIGYGCARFLIQDAHAAGETSPMMRNILVGRDMRKSSPSLAKSLIQGITDQGGQVVDVGLVDTPFLYFAINHLDCAGGVMVTASHNPPQYNGFKVSKRKAKPVGEATGLGDIRKYAATVDRSSLQPAGGRVETRDLWEAYTRHVRSFLDLAAIKKAGLRVVVDASNGMAGTMVPKVFGKKGAEIPGLEILELNFDNTKGEFVHEPNPLVAANLEQLRERVLHDKADLGICFDGDADRCVVVDETGAIIGCDVISGVLALSFLKKSPGSAIIFDLRSTKALPEEITRAGGKPIRSRVGHVFMKQAMAEHNAVFGGELSGHFYFRDNYYADSGAIAMATILTVMAQSGRKLSQLVKPLGRYVQSGEINFQIEDKDAALRQLKEVFAGVTGSIGGGTIDELDGVTVDLFRTQGWWCNVRKSNTEPLLRLNLEARDHLTLERVLSQIAPLLGHRVAH